MFGRTLDASPRLRWRGVRVIETRRIGVGTLVEFVLDLALRVERDVVVTDAALSSTDSDDTLSWETRMDDLVLPARAWSHLRIRCTADVGDRLVRWRIAYHDRDGSAYFTECSAPVRVVLGRAQISGRVALDSNAHLIHDDRYGSVGGTVAKV